MHIGIREMQKKEHFSRGDNQIIYMNTVESYQSNSIDFQIIELIFISSNIETKLI